jgi:UDP-GlcNAc:undecaprenyl-phosphate GlcNAc-1-phosphate transferase
MNRSETQGLLFSVLAFVVAVIIAPVMIRIAARLGLYDAPGDRKVHHRPIPRLGGVAIYMATWTAWGLFAHFHREYIPVEASPRLWGLFWGSTLIWFLGLYDDLRGTNAWQKLSVQLVAALIVIGSGVGIRLLSNPLGGEFYIDSDFVSGGLAVLWIVGVTNAINLIDGLDGLAGGVCMITSLTIFFISKDLGIPHLPFFALCLAGACLGFLMFNFAPAKIFLGDSGSLFLGFVLACLSLMGTVKRSTAIVMFGPPIILALPVTDTLLAIVRRFIRRASFREFFAEIWRPGRLLARLRDVFNADQEHIHHALLKIGLSHRKAVIILYIVTMILGVTAYRTAVSEHIRGTLITFLVLGAALFWLRRKARQSLTDSSLSGDEARQEHS